MFNTNKSAVRQGLEKLHLWVLALFGLCGAGECAAQTLFPSQLTPSTFRVGGGTTAPSLQVPVGEVTNSDGTELSVLISDVVVEGGFGQPEVLTDGVVSSLRARRASVAEIYAAAAAIERLYIEHGYVLVRVTVPPQELKDHGTLRLIVLEGFVEASISKACLSACGRLLAAGSVACRTRSV